MSDGVRVVMTGDKELAAKLTLVGKSTANQPLEDALVKGALKIVQAAKANAPVKSGGLRDSIHIGGHTKETPGYNAHAKVADKGYSTLGGNSHSGTSATVLVGSNAVHAKMQEYGGTVKPKNGQFLVFEIGGKKIFAREVHIPAHPYLRPAFDEYGPESITETGRALWNQIRKAVG